MSLQTFSDTPTALKKERLAPPIEPADDLHSLESTSAWFDRFYQTEMVDALERFKRLRAQGPVALGWGMDFGEFVFPDLWNWHDRPSAMTLTYDGACRVLQNPDIFSHSLYAAELGDQNPLFLDGEPHQQFRRMVLQAFNPKAVRNWEEIAIKIAHELIDEFIDSGGADLVSQFSRLLPGIVFGRFMGVPEEDIGFLTALAVRQMHVFDEQGLQAVRELEPYFAEMISNRRSLSLGDLEKHQDLLSLLCHIECDGRRFNDVEVNTVSHVLVIGGVDTVFKAVAAALYFMLTEPGVMSDVRNDRALLPALGDEALRLASPNVCGAARRATVDTEVDGVDIKEGTAVLVNIPMANRDPSRWDRPWEFDMRRPNRSSLAFGTGPHVCLGMHLGRIVVQAGLNALLDRTSDLRLNSAEADPKLVGLGTLYSPNLHVWFDPSST